MTRTLPDGLVVVVTGASSGIGRATAGALAGRRARLVLAARSPGQFLRRRLLLGLSYAALTATPTSRAWLKRMCRALG